VKRFAVIGDPVAHSKSPAMHMAAYRALGLDCTYEAIRATAADLPELVKALRFGQYDGFNVTAPHKGAILPYVDGHDDDVAVTKAANTLVRMPYGKIQAHNTDVPALAAEIGKLAPERTDRQWYGSSAIVLGSGGAARAACAALHGHGVGDLVVRARHDGTLAPSATYEKRALTIVQATSCGMTGADPGEIVAAAIDWPSLPSSAIALDVVYAPSETPFLRAARARGLRAANGLGMLARQGALAFELWLGVPAPYEIMLAALS
jgi:shikimate dehydrogenase